MHGTGAGRDSDDDEDGDRRPRLSASSQCGGDVGEASQRRKRSVSASQRDESPRDRAKEYKRCAQTGKMKIIDGCMYGLSLFLLQD